MKYILLNLGRKKKQSLFCLLCISVSAGVILADYAMLNGMQEGLREAIDGVLSGRVTVYASDKEGLNILEAQLSEQQAFLWGEADQQALCEAFPTVNVGRRIRIGSLISYGEETSYVNIHALEREQLARVDRLLTFRSGRMAANAGEVVISEAVAGDLSCAVGDTVLLVANNMHDYMSDAVAQVTGIFEERGLAIFLNYNGFMPYSSGVELAEAVPEEALELVINPAEDGEIPPENIEAIGQWLGERTSQPLRWASWEETAPLLHSIVRVWQGGGRLTQAMFILFSLIILIMLTSLIVRSRRRELGTLLAIGFSWRRVQLLLCAEYALLCLVSVVAGAAGLMLLIASLDSGAVTIGSLDMQAALMTEWLSLFLRPADGAIVLFLFMSTTVLSTLISLRRLRRYTIRQLIVNH